MGDHQQGLSFGEGHDGPLDLVFILRVREGGGLIKDDDGRVLQNGPGDGDALTLPAGELLARVPGGGVPSMFQAADELLALAALAAANTSSSEAPGLPSRMFSFREQSKRKLSWVTKLISRGELFQRQFPDVPPAQSDGARRSHPRTGPPAGRWWTFRRRRAPPGP